MGADTKKVYNVCERLNGNILDILTTNASLKSQLASCVDRLDKSALIRTRDIEQTREELLSSIVTKLAHVEQVLEKNLKTEQVKNVSDIIKTVREELMDDFEIAHTTLSSSIEDLTEQVALVRGSQGDQRTNDIVKLVRSDIAHELSTISQQIKGSDKQLGEVKSHIFQAHACLSRNIQALESSQDIIKNDLNILNQQANKMGSNLLEFKTRSMQMSGPATPSSQSTSSDRMLTRRTRVARSRIPQPLCNVAPP